jgi:ADP-ribose pyrophosphatase YjhB (NUDIX family)
MLKVTHPTQIRVLRTLVFEESLSYSELNRIAEPEMSSDNFNFHLKKLISQGIISKEDSHYFIADKGLEYASRIDLQETLVFQQPKVAIALGIFKDESENEFLLNQRLYQPLKNTWGMHTEKMRIGDRWEDVISRCLKNETGITSYKHKQVGISHLIRESDSLVLAHVVHHIFKIYPTNTEEIIFETDQVRNLWVKTEDVYDCTPTTPTFLKLFKEIVENEIVFMESEIEGRI